MKTILLLFLILISARSYGQSPTDIDELYDEILNKVNIELNEYCKSKSQIEAEKKEREKQEYLKSLKDGKKKLTDAEIEEIVKEVGKEAKEKDKRNNKYKATSDGAFNKQIKELFHTVIIGNTDAVNNGSAFAYTQDKDKHKFSANMTFSGKDWQTDLIEIGTSFSGKDNNFKYYDDGKWANNISFKIGYNRRIFSWQNFKDKKCSEISRLRNTEILYKKMPEIKSAVNLALSSKELIKKIKAMDSTQIESLSRGKITLYDDTEAALRKKQLKIIEDLEKVIENLKKIEDKADLTTEEKKKIHEFVIDKYVDKLLSEFDEKNNPFHGYSIFWLNSNLNIANNEFAIKGDTLMLETIQKPFQSRMKSSLEFSGNYNRVGEKSIRYIKLYASLNQISFLDSPNLLDETLSVVPNDTTAVTYYNIVDDENNIIDRYDNSREWEYSYDFGIIYNDLFIFDKTLGFGIRANLNGPSSKGMLYDRNYTLLAGPIFRWNIKEWSIATFTITSGVENQLHNDKDWANNFIIKASVGIPFTVFEKPKPESK